MNYTHFSTCLEMNSAYCVIRRSSSCISCMLRKTDVDNRINIYSFKLFLDTRYTVFVSLYMPILLPNQFTSMHPLFLDLMNVTDAFPKASLQMSHFELLADPWSQPRTLIKELKKAPFFTSCYCRHGKVYQKLLFALLHLICGSRICTKDVPSTRINFGAIVDGIIVKRNALPLGKGEVPLETSKI